MELLEQEGDRHILQEINNCRARSKNLLYREICMVTTRHSYLYSPRQTTNTIKLWLRLLPWLLMALADEQRSRLGLQHPPDRMIAKIWIAKLLRSGVDIRCPRSCIIEIASTNGNTTGYLLQDAHQERDPEFRDIYCINWGAYPHQFTY